MKKNIIKFLDSRKDVRKVLIQNCSVQKRNSMLFSPYQIKVNIQGTNNWIKCGRGTIGHASKVKYFKISDDTQYNEVLEIGHLTEMANDISIIIGGEYYNNEVINLTLEGVLESKFLNRAQKGSVMGLSKSKGTTVIGNAVVISMGVTILSGVTIGNGAVIGANSIVTKNIPDYAIAVGNPAKVIGYRIPEEKIEYSNQLQWWNLKSNILTDNFEKINKLENIQLKPQYYYSEEDNNNYIVMSQIKDQSTNQIANQIIGIERQGKYVPLKDCPEIVRFFVSQICSPADQPVYLIKNLFELMKATA